MKDLVLKNHCNRPIKRFFCQSKRPISDTQKKPSPFWSK